MPISEKDIRIVFSINLSILFQVEYGHHSDIHALPCLRYESQTGKPMSVSYPENPITIGDHIKKKRIELKLLQKDVAKLFDVSIDCVTCTFHGVTRQGVRICVHLA